MNKPRFEIHVHGAPITTAEAARIAEAFRYILDGDVPPTPAPRPSPPAPVIESAAYSARPVAHRRRRFRDTPAAQVLTIAGLVLVAAALAGLALWLLTGGAR